jgi:RNA polymerase sigma factor (TIGR02999 family)
MQDITHLLHQCDEGDPQAAAEILPLVYDELRKLAAAKMAEERCDHTLQPTALVHEAYLRLVGSDGENEWDGRGHFFAAAAEAMRRLLVESARRSQRVKHGGDKQRIAFDQIDLPGISVGDVDLVALDDVLHQLAEEDPTACEVVKLRYFTGLTIEQTAQALGVSVSTTNRNWAYAKAWLYQKLNS